MKYNDNGEYKEIVVKSTDTLPVGTEVDFDGNEVPSGWTAIESYSTNEVKTGENWIDGKPLYRKVINFGALPNNTYKEVDINISNLNNIYKMNGIAIRNDKTTLTIPLGTNIDIYVSSSGKLTITTTTDRSAFNGYVILEYTKTTD